MRNPETNTDYFYQIASISFWIQQINKKKSEKQFQNKQSNNLSKKTCFKNSYAGF